MWEAKLAKENENGGRLGQDFPFRLISGHFIVNDISIVAFGEPCRRFLRNLLVFSNSIHNINSTSVEGKC